MTDQERGSGADLDRDGKEGAGQGGVGASEQGNGQMDERKRFCFINIS